MSSQYLITNNQLQPFVTILRDHLGFIDKPKLFRICKTWTTIFSTALFWTHIELKPEYTNNDFIKWLNNMYSKLYLTKFHSLTLFGASYLYPDVMTLLKSQLQILKITLIMTDSKTRHEHTLLKKVQNYEILKMVAGQLIELTIYFEYKSITRGNKLIDYLNGLLFSRLQKLTIYNAFMKPSKKINRYLLSTAPNLCKSYELHHCYNQNKQIIYEVKSYVLSTMCNYINIQWGENTIKSIYFGDRKLTPDPNPNFICNACKDSVQLHVDKVTFDYSGFDYSNKHECDDVRQLFCVGSIHTLYFDISKNKTFTHEAYDDIMDFIDTIQKTHIKVNKFCVIISVLLDGKEKLINLGIIVNESNELMSRKNVSISCDLDDLNDLSSIDYHKNIIDTIDEIITIDIFFASSMVNNDYINFIQTKVSQHEYHNREINYYLNKSSLQF